MWHALLLVVVAANSEEYDVDVMAQAYLEKCIEEGENENTCLLNAVQMFGSAGINRININIDRLKTDNDAIEGLKGYAIKNQRDARSKVVHRSNCTRANTIYYGGMCHCKLGFPYGDPIMKGCWTCTPKCNKNAICTQNQGCICNNFTIGDGVRTCSTHIPTIVAAYALSDLRTIVVGISPINWTFPRVAYCKFMNNVIEGQLVSEDTIECVRKTKKPQDLRVDVSWDSQVWTQQRFYVKDPTVTNTHKIFIVCCIAAFGGICAYMWYLMGRKTTVQKKMKRYVEKNTL